MTKRTPAQMARRIAMLEAQNADLHERMRRLLSDWGDICMRAIVAEERCKQSMQILAGEDWED